MKSLDIAGEKFGRLVAVRVVSTGKKRIWLCSCNCGRSIEVPTFQLRAGLTKSCGCLKSPNLVGQTFGRLTAVEKVRGKDGRSRYKCVCSCGNSTEVDGPKWRHGDVRSCGCIRQGKRGPRLPNNGALVNSTYGDYRRNAMTKDHEFAIGKDEFRHLLFSPCHYCGQLPSPRNGIDRMDNKNGYVSGNIVSCCHLCNFKKGSQNYEEFVSWISRVYNHLTVSPKGQLT